MGKGDKKTRRGKITIGTYGVRRPKKKNKPVKAVTKKKTTSKAKPKPKAKAETKTKAKPEAKAETKVETKD